MYKLEIKESLDRKLKKLKKKDREMLILIDRKSPNNTEGSLQIQAVKEAFAKQAKGAYGRSFVLIYEINEEEKTVTLLDFDHHDNIYKT